MAEENKEVTQEVTEQPQEEVKQIDESKFESAGDDSVFKVDLAITENCSIHRRNRW